MNKFLKVVLLGIFLFAISSMTYAVGTLTIAKSASIANPAAGITFSYYIQTTCTGNCYNVQITDTLPAGVGYVGVTGSPAPLNTSGVWSWYGGDAAHSMTSSSQTFTFWGYIPAYTKVNVSNTAECFGTQGGDALSTTILAMATSTNTNTPTFTVTATPTFTATPSLSNIRSDGWNAWIADITGNTTLAVQDYYIKASDCVSRGDIVGEAQAYFSAGHTQIKAFNTKSQYNQSTKAIRLMLTPSAQKTAGSTYAQSITTSYTPLLNSAAVDLNNAAVVTGTSTDASNAVNVKLKIDYNIINAVATYVAGHL